MGGRGCLSLMQSKSTLYHWAHVGKSILGLEHDFRQISLKHTNTYKWNEEVWSKAWAINDLHVVDSYCMHRELDLLKPSCSKDRFLTLMLLVANLINTKG